MVYTEGLLEIDKFTSDDGLHHVRWVKPKGYEYEIWYCMEHRQAYYSYCVEYQEIIEKVLAPKD